MFERNKENNLCFKQLEFEIVVHNLLEQTPPKNKKELVFMIRGMIDSIQLVAQEYFCDNFENQDEWEDIYCEM